jgi:hypothetical protein
MAKRAVAVKHTPFSLRNQPSIFLRRRFQLAGAILFAALFPYALRYVLKADLHGFNLFGSNALIGNLAAVLIAFWMRLSIETYPGIQRSYVLLPTALVAHGLVLTFFMVTLVPYDRVSLALGFVLHVSWNYFAYFRGERRYRPRIGVVPYGQAANLAQIEGVDWIMLKHPKVDRRIRFTAIVADFSTDLPDEWEAFLADAALGGRIVYQVKQLAESLTGRVELTQLSENNFGMLVPDRAYFYLKTAADFIMALILLPILFPVMLVAATAIASQRDGPVLFRQLLDLIDDPPAKRRVGEIGFPFVRKVGGEIRDDGVEPRCVVDPGMFEHHPIDAVNARQCGCLAEWNDADARPEPPLSPEIGEIIPQDVESEAADGAGPFLRSALFGSAPSRFGDPGPGRPAALAGLGLLADPALFRVPAAGASSRRRLKKALVEGKMRLRRCFDREYGGIGKRRAR